MFTLAGNLLRWYKKRKEKNMTILLLGLDNAGKSTLLFGLKDQLPDVVTPTIGFRPSKIVKGKYTIEWFDVGGAKNFRRVWQSYYSEVRLPCCPFVFAPFRGCPRCTHRVLTCAGCADVRARRPGPWHHLRGGCGSAGPV